MPWDMWVGGQRGSGPAARAQTWEHQSPVASQPPAGASCCVATEISCSGQQAGRQTLLGRELRLAAGMGAFMHAERDEGAT